MEYKFLDDLGIKYQQFCHQPVFSVEDADKIDAGPGVPSKNLFLTNSNSSKYYLVILSGSKQLDFRQLTTLLNETKLRFASEENLKKYLGVTPGAVSPFGLINDFDHQVVVIVDDDLLKAPYQGFHPNVNTSTLVISTKDFLQFLNSLGNKIMFVSFNKNSKS